MWIIVSFLEEIFLIVVLLRNARREQASKQQLKRQLESVFDQPLLGMAILDLDGNLLHINSELCSMMGYTPDEIFKMHPKQFAYSHEGDDWRLFQQLQNGTRTSYQVEKTYRRKDGTKMWLRLSVGRLRQKGGPARLLAIMEDITDWKTAEQKLNEAQHTLAELPGRLIRVQDDERRLMARELHDDVGQRLSLLIVQLEGISRKLPAGSSERGKLRRTITELDELAHDVHELSHQLYSSRLQYIGLKPALSDLCRRFAGQHGTEISEMLEDVPDLPGNLQFCLYRVAQEALNNVGKHSQARHVSLHLGTRQDGVILEITDNGIGFESGFLVEGVGIASMRERLRTAGGDLTITSKPGQGTRLAAVVPYKNGAVLEEAA